MVNSVQSWFKWLDAAEHVYNDYLSKPYTLDTCKFDWEYKHDSTTVHRPNHGLAHTLRTACYVSIVVKIYNLFNSTNISSTEEENLQLATLFYIVGRENEDTHPSPDFQRFHLKSAEAFEKYVRAKLPTRFNEDRLQFYKKAIQNPYNNPGHAHEYHIIIICHNLDLLRCKERKPYKTRYLKELSVFKINKEHIERLAVAAESCLVSTGDRIYLEKEYDGPLFVACSQNVQVCLTKIFETLKSKLGEFMNPVNPAPPIAPLPEGLIEHLSNKVNPWHQSPTLFERVQNVPEKDSHRKCEVLPDSPEYKFISAYFEHQKPPGCKITNITYIHNATTTTHFEAGLKPQQIQAGNSTFLPRKGYQDEPITDRINAIKRWRDQVNLFPLIVVKEGNTKREETLFNVKVLPLWHGSREDKIKDICTTGFAYFGKHTLDKSTDEGYFGSGIYFTNSARYAAMYGQRRHLFLAWVSMREPYPVVNDKPHPQEGSDMIKLKGRGPYDNYNAHFIPVANSEPDNPASMQYFPCYQNQTPAWDEFVVFKDNQTLPKFWVELGDDLPNTVNLKASANPNPNPAQKPPPLLEYAAAPKPPASPESKPPAAPENSASSPKPAGVSTVASLFESKNAAAPKPPGSPKPKPVAAAKKPAAALENPAPKPPAVVVPAAAQNLDPSPQPAPLAGEIELAQAMSLSQVNPEQSIQLVQQAANQGNLNAKSIMISIFKLSSYYGLYGWLKSWYPSSSNPPSSPPVAKQNSLSSSQPQTTYQNLTEDKKKEFKNELEKLFKKE